MNKTIRNNQQMLAGANARTGKFNPTFMYLAANLKLTEGLMNQQS